MPAKGYIGKLQIDSGDILPIGSTLFGVCHTAASTAAKIVEDTELSHDALGAAFTPLLDGITVHIQFEHGNSVTSGLTLKIADTDAKPISNPGGSCAWSSGAVVSFTYDGTSWVCNDSTIANIPIETTYDGTNSNAISGQGVKAALETLDVNNISGFGQGKTLATLTEADGKISATFQDIEITMSKVTDLPTLGDAAEKNTVSSITDNDSNNSNTVPTTSAITSYITTKTAGLTGAMHFKGEVQTLPTETDTNTFNTYESGDVILFGDKEYVYNKGNNAAASEWILLGDEGSYALKTNTENVIKTATFTPDVPGALTTKNTTIPNVTSAGSAATFSVASGVLSITTGSAPTLGTDITIKEVDTWTAGSAASLSTTTQTVVVPGSNS